jgi:4-amino-4-deoxychorismate lyase
MSGSGVDRTEINGAPATAAQLRHFAVVNYGHFTSMQVRDGAARGLGLHLDRLDRSTRELFGRGLDPERVRGCIRQALQGERGHLSVRVIVSSSSADATAEPDVLVTTSAGVPPSPEPLRVRSVGHQRVLPHIKHLGTFGIAYHLRRARRDGFDDALLADPAGSISEGTIWNVGFFDGTGVTWPSAPALAGITMQLVRSGLERRGVCSTVRDVRLADVRSYRSAFLTNSISIAPIASVDDVELVTDPELMALLRECRESSPWEPV